MRSVTSTHLASLGSTEPPRELHGTPHSVYLLGGRALAGALVVGDEEVRHAMRVAFEMLQIVLEPGGAAGLAAVLAGKLPGGSIRGKTICIIASGGNLNLEKFAKVLGCPNSKM